MAPILLQFVAALPGPEMPRQLKRLGVTGIAPARVRQA
jgi:hypothetical protein